MLRRGGKNTQKNYTKKIFKPDKHDCVITDLEPDILECRVKWPLRNITMNKASGGDGILVELFQILKDDSMKVLHSIYVSKFRKLSSSHRTGKLNFHSNPIEWKCQRMFKLPHNCTHLTCQQNNTQNSPSQASTVHEL